MVGGSVTVPQDIHPNTIACLPHSFIALVKLKLLIHHFKQEIVAMQSKRTGNSHGVPLTKPALPNSALLLHKLQHKLLSNYSSPGVDGDLHAADLFVDIFHELDNEID